MAKYVLLLIQVYFVHACAAWDHCYYNYYSYAYKKLRKSDFYCSTSCCGYIYDRYCCAESGTIAGAVVGGIICMVVLAGIIVCCVKSHLLKPGRVIRPGNNVNSERVHVVQSPPYQTLPPQYYRHLPDQPGTQNSAFLPPSAPPAPPGYTPQMPTFEPIQPPPYTGPPPKY